MTTSKSYISLKEKYDRVIVLIDMDCFYCQVEELLDEKLKGKPIAVVQYVENAGIIAVNYAARALGVTRHMREKEAKLACPELVCVKVPSKFNKADISKYRDAGKRVASVFEKFKSILERASIDEAYLDITELVAERVQQMRDKSFTLTADHLQNTYVVGYENIGKFIHEISLAVDNNNTIEDDPEKKSLESSKLRLLIGASIVSDIRRAVKEDTGYTCSAGIAHNKILAKLVCGMNKPNKQTVIPIESTLKLFEKLEISKIKSMGGKIGEEVCKKLDVKFMVELLPFGESELQQQFGPRIGSFLYWISRGVDLEKVERKVMSKSIAVSKNFRGKNEIMNVNTLKYWLKELSKELKERVDQDFEETTRVAKQMIVQFTQVVNKKDVASSRTVALNGKTVNSFSAEEIGEEAFKTIERNTQQLVKAEGTFLLCNNVKHLGISAGKLEEPNAPQGSNIQDFMKNHKKSSPKVSKLESTTTGNDFALTKYDYVPPKAMGSKSDHAVPTIKNPFKSKVKSPATTKSETFVPKTTEEKIEVKSEVSYSPNKPESKESIEACLKSHIKFTIDNSIRGERTLKHWMNQLFSELDKKVMENKSNPSKVNIIWKQLKDDGVKNFSEDIPLDIFPNGINVNFFVNLIKDSVTQIADKSNFDPICFIEIKANEMSAELEKTWKLNVNDLPENNDTKVHTDENQLETSVNEAKSEVQEDTQYPTNFTPTDDFYDADTEPQDLLSVELKVDDDEEEILRLERSFLGMSPAKKESKIPEEAKSPEKLKPEEAGPSYKSNYIELQQPSNVSAMIDVLNPLEPCVECGKMIRKLEMMTHIDGHIAMKLSLAQREEYRSEQKRRLLQNVNIKSNKKVQKAKAPSKVNTKVNMIEKFARKESSNETSHENSVLCEKCNQLIELEHFEMHQDHHFAQKLRMEQMTVRTISSSGTKRKRPQVSQKSDPTNAKSLKEYFK